MTAVSARLPGWSVVLALMAAACGNYIDPGPTPEPTRVVRAGELYTCSNGVDGCRVTYEIGPVVREADRLRVYFLVTLEGPSGGTTSWTNDTSMHAYLKGEGRRGIVLSPASGGGTAFELMAVGGIAARDVTLVAPVRYQGYWEFVVGEPAGTELLLTYPDFDDRPAPVVVPE